MNTTADPQELARYFNKNEAVWRAFERKRELRRLLGSQESFSEKALDDLDWAEAERECREVHCVGKFSSFRRRPESSILKGLDTGLRRYDECLEVPK